MLRLAALAVVLLALVPAASAGGTPWPQDHDPVFSPDGGTVAFVRSYGTIQALMLVGADGRHLRTLVRQSGIGYLSWSPDGTSLAYAAGGDVWRVDLDAQQPVRLTDDAAAGGEAWQPSWSPDGKLIAFDRFERCFRCTGVWVMNADGAAPREVLQDGRRPMFSPDGTKLALSLASNELVVDLSGNVVVPGAGAYTVWSPKGAYVAWAEGALHVVNVETQTARVVTRLITQKPAWSPGGKYIAGGGFESIVAVVRAKDGSHYTKLPDSTVLGGVPSWAPNGLLAYVHAGPQGAYCGIDVAHPDGTHVRRLTHDC